MSPTEADAAGGLPAGLADALARREALITERRQERARVYLRASSRDGALFARFSTDPLDVPVLAHEARVRALVPAAGPLRAPAVLEAGETWLLEQAIDPARVERSAELVAAAAAELARLELPDGPGGPPPSRVARVRRRLGVLRSALPAADVLRARRLLGATRLPRAASHGDFHPGNVLIAAGACWVVDWELTGRRPLGFDLMRYWTGATEEERPVLFEGAVALAGEEARAELLRLRYVVAVQTVAGKLAARNDFDRDLEGGRALLELLPALRREAGL
jgi:hypothetical protein